MPIIGIFDSGVGGLSVLRHIRSQLPAADLVYLADQAHVPYGGRTLMEIRHFSQGITQFLLAEGANLIVVACNTASGAALTYLRETFPQIPFVGMEPAVKPAARQTRSGKVGVLATVSTFGSPRYARLMSRFASTTQVFEDPCVGLVPLIEAGKVDTVETAVLLRRILAPMLTAGVDTLVLGCTHYPFVQPLIERLVADLTDIPVTIIDPAPAVAQQTVRLLPAATKNPDHRIGGVKLLTTGDAAQMQPLVRQWLGEAWEVETAVWQQHTLSRP